MASSEPTSQPESSANTESTKKKDSSELPGTGWIKLFPRTTRGILAAITFSVLIPLLLLQTAIYVFWYKTRTQAEMNANLEMARYVASAFESYIDDIRRQEIVVSNTIDSRGESFKKYAERLLSVLRDQYPAVLRFSLVDQNNVIVASSNRAAVGLSVANRNYVREIRAGKEWTVSNLDYDPMAGQVAFYIVCKLHTKEDREFLIVAVVDPVKLGRLVLSISRPAEGTFALFDREGTLAFFSGNLPYKHISWKSMDPVLAKTMRGEEAVGKISYPLNGIDHIVARVPILSFGWITGASRAVDTVMAPIYRTLIWVAVLNGAILIISIVGAIALSQFLIRRLRLLREHARLIAGGEFGSRTGVRNPVELAELSRAFNLMADEVRIRQESLQKAIGDLTRSNQELEQFAYVASHDLQEPLRVIAGFVQLLEKKYKGNLDQDADRYISFITDAVSRQQELIRDLLTYSRLGRDELKLVPTDCNTVIKAALLNIRQLIVETQTSIALDALPVVQADRSQLVPLFQNLLHNAIKFRGPTNPEIRISVHPDNSKWIFAVQDNGIGIEPQYWEQIFVMFKRLHTRKDYPGTGIGLAVCKRIVERHGGSIWVDSKPGEGSTFYFSLMAAGEK